MLVQVSVQHSPEASLVELRCCILRLVAMVFDQPLLHLAHCFYSIEHFASQDRTWSIVDSNVSVHLCIFCVSLSHLILKSWFGANHAFNRLFEEFVRAQPKWIYLNNTYKILKRLPKIIIRNKFLTFHKHILLSQLYDRRPLFLGDGGSVSTVIAGSCFRKASENQSFIFLPPLDLSPETTRYVGGGWSMVDGSDETTQIVFGECLARSAWDTDEIAME
ncbi:BnaA06g16880D [Brassica napus]|uniref:BnaA06g16880D protein n=1 Tax=Brassica napus TaxID=3708 RepID=A0A078HJ88_BRANA|nr:BnaA06g16880D [Brassica napus]